MRFFKIDPVLFARIERDPEIARMVLHGNEDVLERMGVAASDRAVASEEALRFSRNEWQRGVRARLRREALDPTERLSFFESFEGRSHILPLSAVFAPQGSRLVRALGANGVLTVANHALRWREGAPPTGLAAVFLSPVRAGWLSRRQPDLGEAVLSLARRAHDERAFLLVVEE